MRANAATVAADLGITEDARLLRLRRELFKGASPGDADRALNGSMPEQATRYTPYFWWSKGVIFETLLTPSTSQPHEIGQLSLGHRPQRVVDLRNRYPFAALKSSYSIVELNLLFHVGNA